MKFDAFISYRRENGFLMAQVIRDRLKEKGIFCFLDLEEDKSGDFNENLLGAIADAPNFILILPKNALTRCKNEDDWVRREIIAAVRSGKTIIPVMYDGFTWPKKWAEGIPKEIRQLASQQAVSMSQEYLSAMIDKIISYMKGVSPVCTIRQDDGSTALPRDSVDFMSRIKDDPAQITDVCMAFHAGGHWRRDSEKLELLQFIMDHKLNLKVIVNREETAAPVCSHMRQPLKKYVGFDNCVAEWTELQEQCPESIHVRAAKVPLLHRIYLIRFNDGTGIVNIKYYSYGNWMPAKDFRRCFDSTEPEYALYAQEFDYLWNHACDS